MTAHIRTDTSGRLAALRALFPKHKISVFVVFSEDEHQSEYTGAADKRRDYVSGFTGSSGTAIISQTNAALETDGRYFLQAAMQLDSNWELLKQGMPGVLSWMQWAVKEAANGPAGCQNIGVDPRLITYASYLALEQEIKDQGLQTKVKIVAVPDDLVAQVWPDQPARPQDPVYALETRFSGCDFRHKLAKLRAEVKAQGCTALVVTALDEVAWMFNLRGSDIEYNPVFFAYAVLPAEDTRPAVLYIDDAKVSPSVRTYLGRDVVLRPYASVFRDLRETGLVLAEQNRFCVTRALRKRLMVAGTASWAVYRAAAVGDGPDLLDNLRSVKSPVETAKNIKNEVELANARIVQIKDGLAVTQFLAWLEHELVVNKTVMTEYESAQHCLRFRAAQPHFRGLSFETIASTGGNAAIIHHAPDKSAPDLIDPDRIYLLDSGGQYLDGTTDTTRTVHFGQPAVEEIKAYTLVLKGAIALTEMVFPRGTNGFTLDPIARQHLWRHGLDYLHGTSHGVGSFLNVHEGTLGIGFRDKYRQSPIDVDATLTIEPGCYEEGKYGVRIENVCVTVPVETYNHTAGRQFVGFEAITMVPLCRKLIDVSMLTEQERSWVDAYHVKVRATLEGLVNDDLTRRFLLRETEPL